MKYVYLASNSPRRQEILRMMGIEFEVVSADVDESMLEGELPSEMVIRLAKQKAQAAITAHELSPAGYVIAGDTLVAFENRILGKPKNKADASDMLMALSDQTHEVYSSVVVAHKGEFLSALNHTRVSFAKLDPQEVDDYLSTDEAYDKAGAYAIQGYAAKWIKEIHGSYHAVVGMPVFELEQLLKQTEFYTVNH